MFSPLALTTRFEGQGLVIRRSGRGRGSGKTEKWDSPILCPFISLRCPQNASVKLNSKYPTDNLLHHCENAYFEWKQEQAVFVHVSLNANELLFPAPFSRIELRLYRSYRRYCAKNICLVLIIMFIALKSCILNHISLNF